MAKFTDLPLEIIEYIAEYLLLAHKGVNKKIGLLYAKKGEGLAFFNAREVNRVFFSATARAFFKGRLETLTKRDVAVMEHRMGLEKKYALIQYRLPRILPGASLCLDDRLKWFDARCDHSERVLKFWEDFRTDAADYEENLMGSGAD